MDQDSAKARTEEEAGLPFARVMVVVTGSPADKAGIRQGDLVIKFGTVSKVKSRMLLMHCVIYLRNHFQDNFTNLKNISDLAESSRNRAVEVIVSRDRRVSRLRLVPATWTGAGLIGFKIRPVAEDEGVDR